MIAANPADIWLPLVVPLCGALLIWLSGRMPALRDGVSLLTAGTMFWLIARLLPRVQAGERPAMTVAEIIPGLSLAFEVEPLGLLFALVASGLWIVTTVYSIGYMRGKQEANQTRFYICFAVALGSTIGAAFSANLLTLFIFYEILTLVTYPLVTHAGTPEALRGGRVYLGVLLGTSIGMLLLAVIWTWNVAGTLDFTRGGILAGAPPGVAAALLALFVFGIGKAAMMPFHRWLPAAMVAPAPVSALLHAVAVVKVGVFSVLKVAVYIFGLDLLGTLTSGRWLLWAAAATILIASLVALRQDNLKLRLAYSTVSQLAYIVMGALLATPLAIAGGAMHIATHAFGKITLFFCAGAIDVALKRKNISEMRGIGHVMPVTMTAFFVASLSIIGLPPLGGLWSKWYLALGTLEADESALLAVLMISSLLNVAYLLPVSITAFLRRPEEGGWATTGINEAPWPCVAALAFTALGCVVLFFFPDPLYELAGMIVPQ